MVEISRDSNNDNGEKKEIEEERQSAASHNVSLFFGIKYVGIFLTAYLSGFLLEYIEKRQSFVYKLVLLIKTLQFS